MALELDPNPEPPAVDEEQLNPLSPPPDPEVLEDEQEPNLLQDEPEHLDNLADYLPIEAVEALENNILQLEPELPEVPLEQLQNEGEGAAVSAEQDNENAEAELNGNADANAMADAANPQEEMQHAIETLQQEHLAY